MLRVLEKLRQTRGWSCALTNSFGLTVAGGLDAHARRIRSMFFGAGCESCSRVALRRGEREKMPMACRRRQWGRRVQYRDADVSSERCRRESPVPRGWMATVSACVVHKWGSDGLVCARGALLWRGSWLTGVGGTRLGGWGRAVMYTNVLRRPYRGGKRKRKCW